jgi:hypothetical protein
MERSQVVEQVMDNECSGEWSHEKDTPEVEKEVPEIGGEDEMDSGGED